MIADRDGAHLLDRRRRRGNKLGRCVLRRGHMALLPRQSAYRLRAGAPAAVVFQTIEGPETISKWSEICQTDGGRPQAAPIAGRGLPSEGTGKPGLKLETRFETGQPDPDTGYRSVQVGGFAFRRDRYFAYVSHGEVHHQMPVDAFLRALMRDVAWGFFYGTVNFDDVLGTTNHYGEVEMFLGA